MSSVLEALKRMEEEAPREDVASLPEKWPGRRAGAMRWISFFFVFAAGMGVAAAVFYLADRGRRPEVPVTEGPKAVSVFRVVAPPESPAARSGETRAMEKIAPPGVAAPAAIKAPMTQKLRRKDSPAANASDATIGSDFFMASADEPDGSRSGEAPVAPPEEARDLPEADGATFKLQGVRWSETPSRRIAVINGQIVREGAVVSGATVATIAAEGVTLEVAGVYQFLAFGSK